MAIRVLQIVTHMNRGGLETMIMNYYRHINREKIQFDFLTHREYDGDYGEEIMLMGGNIYHISKLNPFSLSYLKELKTFFLEHKEYEIIHVHQDCMSGIILKVAEECKIPVRIAHCHSSGQDFNLKYFIKLYYKRYISKYATKLYSCGRKSGNWMFGKNSNFTVLPNAIMSNEYSYSHDKAIAVRRKLGIKNDDIVIGHVGRFCQVKNHSYLVKIVKVLCDKSSKYKLLLVGQGELMDEVKKQVKSEKIEDNVIFLGLRNDVSDILQAMDVFVFPSIYEGLPVSMIEAQAAGLKCIISDGVPIECDITGNVSQMSLECSPEEWADTIASSVHYERVDMHEKIANAGFDIVDNSLTLEEFYKNCLK